MARDLGSHLFTFAILSDSHVNEAEDRSTSPYASNRLANARLRWVVTDLNRRRPEFTVHLGDMANPLPELRSWARAVANFQAITARLGSPLHVLPGNHCVGDKPTGWVPVPRVSAEALSQYERQFGRDHCSFAHGPCRFFLLNSLLLNADLEAAEDQRRWLERELAEARANGERLWVMMHYPPYVAAPDELDSYDNLDEPGRSWLLGLLERHRVEAAYSGHVHNYFYNRYARTDLYTLPATSFVRQDYGELFRVEPGDEEGGRDDRAKLGYCLVGVYERGHVNHVVRTWGRTLEPEASIRSTGPVEPAHPRPAAAAVGMEMRENWLATVALHTNNSVSPFTRRRARNDWAVLALEEMGVRKVRVALQELVAEDVLERMATLTERGYEFTVYSHGLPGERALKLVRRNRALLAGWELILDRDGIEAVAGGQAEVAVRLSGDGTLPCYLSEMRDISRGQIDDANVKHEANYGFQAHERERIERLCDSEPLRAAFRGLTFRVRRRGEPLLTPWRAVREIGRMGRASGMRHQAHILFSGSLTAERLVDDLANANRVAESALAAAVAGNVDVCFDTFEDIDRGYFVRHGLVDRRFNPRLAANVLRWLQASVSRYCPGGFGEQRVEELQDGRLVLARCADRLLALALPRPRLILNEVDALGAAARETLTLLDLATGLVTELPARRRGSRVRVEPPLEVRQPQLLVV